MSKILKKDFKEPGKWLRITGVNSYFIFYIRVNEVELME